MKLIKQKIFIVIFLTLLIFPAIIQISGIKMVNDNTNKNKEVDTFPILDFPHVGRFRVDFDKYYKNNFGGINLLVKKYNQFKYYVLRTSPLPKSVIIGKDGWLFLGNSYSNVIDETIGYSTFSGNDLDTLLSIIKEREQWLSERNINYYLCIAPNKHSVYYKKTPNYIKYKPDETKLNILKSYLHNNNFELIDLKDNFHQHIDSIRLFHKTNTHWNEFGAFLGYQVLLNKIKLDFPEINILTINDFNIDTIISKKEDLTNMIKIEILENKIRLNLKYKQKSFKIESELKVPENYFRKPNNYEQRYKSSNKLKVLIFRDSFSSAMIKYISESFGECVFIWHHDFNKELIEREKPDIVIHEIVERSIEVLMKKN